MGVLIDSSMSAVNGNGKIDEEWQSGSLSQDIRNIYCSDHDQVSLNNVELEERRDNPEKKPHKYISLGCCRKKQGFNIFGHCLCLLLIIFILSLVLIVALMYWMD